MKNLTIEKGTKKARYANYVIYDIDYLLDHLAQEVYLLESYRKAPKALTLEEFKKRIKEAGD